MNCQEFEASINDLARDQIMDIASRNSALAHGEGCAKCAARLADERVLSAGLRYLAASASDDQAPAKIEAALLAAFREHKQTATAPASALFEQHRMADSVLRTRMADDVLRTRRWAIAAAAAILILITLVALRANQSAPEPVREATLAEPAPGVVQPAPPAPPEKENPDKSSVTPVNRKRNAQKYNAADRQRRAAPYTEARNGEDAAASDYEITTDFLPLTPRGSLAQLEGGHMVRVELPRSALSAFGLPVNLERAGERIKADVVVGNDGMARAIRFVR
jgi:hypothetical protein